MPVSKAEINMLSKTGRRRQQYKLNGLCYDCGGKHGPVRPGYIICEFCSQRHINLRYRIKIEVLTHYSNGTPKCSCQNCPEHTNPHLDFLTIDHIGGGGKQHRKQIKETYIYRWLRTNNFPDGYRVLCINCNFAIGKTGTCPHLST